VQALEGSFSAVSTPIFASKYSFCSIFRDLQDLQSFAPLQVQNLTKKFDQLFQISAEISAKITIFQQFALNFPPILMKNLSAFREIF
jgi:hypothetical protein